MPSEQPVDYEAIPPLPGIEYFKYSTTSYSRSNRWVAVGLAFCFAMVAALSGYFLVLGVDDEESVSAVAAPVTQSEVTASTLAELSNANLGDPNSVTTISPIEVSEEAEDSETTARLFSANREACTSLYGNPTADVAFFMEAEDEATTTSSSSSSTSTTVANTPVKPPTPSTTPTTAKPTTTNPPTTAAPTTEQPTTTTPTTAAPTTPVPAAPPAPAGWADAGNGINVPIELIVIRCCESRNNYVAQNPTSTASGAYQFLDGTWAGRFGVSRAMFASPSQQDEAAIDLWRARGTQPWNASKHCWGLDA